MCAWSEAKQVVALVSHMPIMPARPMELALWHSNVVEAWIIVIMPIMPYIALLPSAQRLSLLSFSAFASSGGFEVAHDHTHEPACISTSPSESVTVLKLSRSACNRL